MSFEGTIENVTKIETDGCDKFSTKNMISRFCGRLVVDYLFWPICGWVLKAVLRIKLAPWLAHGRPSQMWKNSRMMTNSIKLMRLFIGSRNFASSMKTTEIGIKLGWKTWASRKGKVGGGEEEKFSTFFLFNWSRIWYPWKNRGKMHSSLNNVESTWFFPACLKQRMVTMK